jgi:hypothetical protein
VVESYLTKYSVLVTAVGADIKVTVVESYLTKNRVLVAAVGADIEVHSGRAISYQEQSPGSSCRC